VTDKHGTSINGLNASDFVLLDDGKSRAVQVDTIDSGLPPVALVTLVQTSDLSLSALGKIRKTGSMISDSVLGANGEAAVVTFDSDIKLVQNFTTDEDAISDAFRDLKASDAEGGRMIDAVQYALAMLQGRSGPRRQIILLIGESKDRGSKGKLENLATRLEHRNVTIYALSYSAYITPFTTKASDYTPPNGGGLLKAVTEIGRLGKENTANALTEVTGGRHLAFETKGKLEDDLIAVAADIHNRYILSFTPDLSESPRFHHLQLQVKNHPDAVIVMRTEYWSGLNNRVSR
jgi:VWFA-related protein